MFLPTAIRLKDDMVLEKRPFTMLEKIPKPPKPREIPSVKEDTDWRVNNAAVMLQKVIKGRALQVEVSTNKIYTKHTKILTIVISWEFFKLE